jgi:hypothetical protein
MSHTKGPWRVYEKHNNTSVEMREGLQFVPQTCLNLDEVTSEIIANAQLISAVPELLETLEKLINKIQTCEQNAINNDDSCYDLEKEIKQAIRIMNKAKGQD